MLVILRGWSVNGVFRVEQWSHNEIKWRMKKRTKLKAYFKLPMCTLEYWNIEKLEQGEK